MVKFEKLSGTQSAMCAYREHDTFYRISASQGGPRADGNAYNKMDKEIAKLNDKVAQA